MSSTLTNQISGDAMGSETFASLWATLQTSYEGTNITRTVARLLHMYQPEDGILAYERLLRTLYVLLENFNTNGFRLLVSMVPPPKDSPESTIQEVFQKATGFSRMTPHASQTNLVHSAKEAVSNGYINHTKVDQDREDMNQCSKITNKGDGTKKLNDSHQTASPDPIEFRGFPSNEICNTQIRVQNINQFHEPTAKNYLSQAFHTHNQNTNDQTSGKIPDQQNKNPSSIPTDYRMKWIYTPYFLRKNAICQSTQFYQDPLVIFQTADKKHLGIPMSQINQFQRGDRSRNPQKCSENSKKPLFIDLSDDQVCNQEEKVNSNSVNNTKSVLHRNISKETEKINLDFQIKVQDDTELNEEETTHLKEKVKLKQRAIQEDIFKMDVVQTNAVELNSTATPQVKNLDPEDLEVHNELRQSIQKFLQRVKNEEIVSDPVIPKPKVVNPITQEPVTDETTAFIDCWKKIITRSVLGRDPKSNSPDSNKSSNFSREKIRSSFGDDTEIKRETTKKVRRKKPNPPTRSKSERVAQRIPNQIQVDEMENESSSSKISKRMNNMNSNKELVLGKPNPCSQIKSCELNPINMLQQANSISELATYKKQYYDALLSIQRAKVAVANSLAISTVGNATGYDPYYFNYLHRQHQLMQHQQRVLMGTQFSSQRPLHPVVPNNHNTPSSWTITNDWRYPSFGQFRIPRHSQAMYSSSMSPTSYSFLTQNSATDEVRQYGENQCDQLRPNIKRKKLEDVVGKLKQPENIGTQQNSSPH